MGLDALFAGTSDAAFGFEDAVAQLDQQLPARPLLCTDKLPGSGGDTTTHALPPATAATEVFSPEASLEAKVRWLFLRFITKLLGAFPAHFVPVRALPDLVIHFDRASFFAAKR